MLPSVNREHLVYFFIRIIIIVIKTTSAVIHIGDNTQTQLQDITPSSFNIIKVICKRSRKVIEAMLLFTDKTSIII